MAISARLELRQSQQLVMTPQLQQAIRLLQLSNLELNEFVDAELERNPLLEREVEEPLPTSGVDQLPSKDTGESAAERDGLSDLALGAPSNDASQALDTDFESAYPEEAPVDYAPSPSGDGLASGDSWASLRQRGNGPIDGDADLEAYVSEMPSLRDHLLAQLNLATAVPAERLIAQHIIDMVDEAGYVRGDLAALTERLGATDTMVESVLALLQTFEPTGVCARWLGECLALQLREANRYDPQIAGLLENLDMLAGHNLAGLRRKLDIDATELADMINEIKGLNPKPGLEFGTVAVQPVVPDVMVRAAEDGSWRVELNTETLPRVLVNRSYYTTVSKHTRSANDKEYLVDCLQTANWLTKSLDQRARTILRVAEEIVRQQDGFLTHGVQYLRPLNLKTVADAISMHESTVSRVTSNKYMATSRGIFELKYFFTSAIASAGDGEAHSSEAVRHRIRQLIDAEAPAAVLSDDKLVEKLKADGIDIARRTVAKYRESMRIPSSVQRRREKKMQAQVAASV
ncbi:MAG: RNA polymerase factor sigma-54 [Pseudomonadota bacterium]